MSDIINPGSTGPNPRPSSPTHPADAPAPPSTRVPRDVFDAVYFLPWPVKPQSSSRRVIRAWEEETFLIRRVNHTLLVLQCLWRGVFSDDVLRLPRKWFGVSKAAAGKLSLALTERVRRAHLDLMPSPDRLRGAEALRRLIGDRLKGLPYAGVATKRESSSTGFRKGDICSAKVDLIALPPEGSAPVWIGSVSQKAGRLVTFLRQRMLRKDGSEAVQNSKIKAYTDPALRPKAAQLRLAARMFKAGMLRFVKTIHGIVSFFTVVKNVDPNDSTVITAQRLVMDERVENLRWHDPPWTGLSTPSTLAYLELDLSLRFGEEMAKEFTDYIANLSEDQKKSLELRMKVAAGDVPNFYYMVCIHQEEEDPPLSSFFCFPTIRAKDLARYFRRVLKEELPGYLRHMADYGIAVAVLVMGFKWAVYLAQLCLEDLVGRSLFHSPLRTLTHARPLPRVSQEAPVVSTKYIDDFGSVGVDLWLPEVGFVTTAVRSAHKEAVTLVRSAGLDVHKEQEEALIIMLGYEIGGHPPRARLSRAKMWLLIEASWVIVYSETTTGFVISVLLGHWAWATLPARPGFSVFAESYKFAQMYYENPTPQLLWTEIKREFAGAIGISVLLYSDLAREWNFSVYMVDASNWGSGVIQTQGTLKEIQAEADLSVFGGWHMALGDDSTEPIDETRIPIPLEIPQTVPVFWIWILGAGLPRQDDFGEILSKVGASLHVLVRVRHIDRLADGTDLLLRKSLEDLRLQMKLPSCDAVVVLPPTSTWRWVRRSSGHWLPFRSVKFPWGLPWTRRQAQVRRRVQEASQLLSVMVQLLVLAGQLRLLTYMIHLPFVEGPEFPSIWELSEVAEMAELLQLRRQTVNFLRWYRTGTALTKCGVLLPDVVQDLLEGESGDVLDMVVLADGLVKSLISRGSRVGTEQVDAKLLDDLCVTAKSDLDRHKATRERTAPIGECWSRLNRWRELFRMQWKHAEHNNILELHSALQALKHACRSVEGWSKRLMLFSDSQVVLGALLKGRSPARAILRGCRKAASLLLGCGVTLYGRYVETHRNYADGPSRAGRLGVFQAVAGEPVRIKFPERGSKVV